MSSLEQIASTTPQIAPVAPASMSVTDVLSAAGLPATLVAIHMIPYTDLRYRLRSDRASIVPFVHDPRFRIHAVGLSPQSGESAHFFNLAAAVEALRTRFGAHAETVTLLSDDAFFTTYALRQHAGFRPAFVLDLPSLARSVFAMKSADLTDFARHFRLRRPFNIARLGAHSSVQVQRTPLGVWRQTGLATKPARRRSPARSRSGLAPSAVERRQA